MRHDHVPEGNLAAPEGFHVDIEHQAVGVKQGRSALRFAPVQRKAVKTRAQRAPCEMEIAQLNARAGSPLQLLDNRAARPQIGQSAGDDISNRQAGDERQADGEPQPVLQSEFSFRAAHAIESRSPLTVWTREASVRSLNAILFRPAISR